MYGLADALWWRRGPRYRRCRLGAHSRGALAVMGTVVRYRNTIASVGVLGRVGEREHKWAFALGAQGMDRSCPTLAVRFVRMIQTLITPNKGASGCATLSTTIQYGLLHCGWRPRVRAASIDTLCRRAYSVGAPRWSSLMVTRRITSVTKDRASQGWLLTL